MEINPNNQIRNQKQVRNPKKKKRKKAVCFSPFFFFGFGICFGFRDSDFGFAAQPR
jgi:hypothetical protein